MRETHLLMHDLIQCAGAKKVALALGYDVAHVYRMARDPNDTGAPNVFDRLEALVTTVAADPDGRPAVRRAQLHIDAMFKVTLDNFKHRPVEPEEIVARAIAAGRESLDVVEVAAAKELNVERCLTELLEAREAIDRAIDCLQAVEENGTKSIRRIG